MFAFLKSLFTRRPARYQWQPALEARNARIAAVLITFPAN